MYKLTEQDQAIVRLADMAAIPRDPANSDYQAFLRWEAEGNVPLPTFTEKELLEMARQSKLREIEESKLAHASQPLVLDGYSFDADYENIPGAVIAALVDPTYTTTWVTADNQVVSLSSAQVVTLGQLLKEQKTFAVIRARELKDQALAATIQEQLEAIVW